MRISFNDCHGHRGHILGVHETVCDVVLHMSFLMRNGGHYTAFFLYLTLFHSEIKDFGQGQHTFSHAEHYQVRSGEWLSTFPFIVTLGLTALLIKNVV